MQSYMSFDHKEKAGSSLNEEDIDALINDQLYAVLDKEDKVVKN